MASMTKYSPLKNSAYNFGEIHDALQKFSIC